MKMSDLIEITKQIEYHAQMLAKLGKQAGFDKITDKTKWRELVMAGKLGHKAFGKISAGKNSDKYGADANDPFNNKNAEYKSTAILDDQLNNLLEKVRNKKTNSRYVPLSIKGMYNGAYNHESVDRYSEHDHYFGVFYDERCVLIVKPHNDYVIETLRKGVNKIISSKGKTTNGNSVTVNLGKKDLYEVVYRDEEWYKDNA